MKKLAFVTKQEGTVVTIHCPLCQKEHRHGVPDGIGSEEHRVSHCATNTVNTGYYITAAHEHDECHSHEACDEAFDRGGDCPQCEGIGPCCDGPCW